MGIYGHFELQQPPFDTRANEQLFFPASAHAEALATARFAIDAGKACVAIAGGSGLGKTLTGRLLVQGLSANHHVLWVPGAGQVPERVEGFAMVAGAQAELQPTTTGALTAWLRCSARRSKNLVVVVDDADDLHPGNWQQLLAMLSREIDLPGPLTVVLLGGKRFSETLAEPDLLRLRRRVFRVCLLKPFATDDVPRYLAHRLAAAGGTLERVFTPNAVEQVTQLARGNPGLINQLADNALIEAVGADHVRVEPVDVTTAAHAMLGIADPVPFDHRVSDASAVLVLPPATTPALAPLADPAQADADPDSEFHDDAEPPATISEAFEARMQNLQHRVEIALQAVRAAQGLHVQPTEPYDPAGTAAPIDYADD